MTRVSSILAILLLAGCASAAPKLYTLETRPGAVRTGAPAAVTVRSFGLPRYLDRPEIVRSAGPQRVAAADDDWWAEPLRLMLRRVMVDDLGQRLPGTVVLAAEGGIAGLPGAELRVELQSFERDDTGMVTLVGVAAIETPGRPPTMDRLRVSTPVAGAGIGDQAAAMSTALGQAADILAARLAPRPVVFFE